MFRRRRARYPCCARKNIVKMHSQKTNIANQPNTHVGNFALANAIKTTKTMRVMLPYSTTLFPGFRLKIRQNEKP